LVRDRPGDALEGLRQQTAEPKDAYTYGDLWAGLRTAHALLYSGDAEAAHVHLLHALKRFNASPLSRAWLFRCILGCMSALAALRAGAPAARRYAERVARSFGTHESHAAMHAYLLRAQSAASVGDWEGTRVQLEQCVERGEQYQSPMFALYAQRALGQVLGGDEGAALIAATDAELRAHAVSAPERWSRIWIDVMCKAPPANRRAWR
jgi:hypothetical protein